VAVFDAIKAARSGQFSGGQDIMNTLANDGVDYGTLGPAGVKFAPQLTKVKSEIKSGKISNIPSTVP
jgi:basic membrane lipoprotein Med (substrate-binding protein (PBP1-ABC) superfamily)